jgi:hypothetical protein
MKILTPRYRCPLSQWQGNSPDPEDIKRAGWRDQGILVISAEDQRLDWMERQLLKQIAERLYGRREASHG